MWLVKGKGRTKRKRKRNEKKNRRKKQKKKTKKEVHAKPPTIIIERVIPSEKGRKIGIS